MSPISLQLPPSPPSHSRPPSHPNNLFLDSAAAVHLLNSSAAQRDLRLTTCLHAGLFKSGLHSNLFVANSLLDAYSKCGRLDCATELFDRMPQRDVVSWTSLISGHCHNGAAHAAVRVFLNMLSEGAAPLPNEFTVAAVLRACALLKDEKLGRMMHGFLISNGFHGDNFVLNSLIDTYSKLGYIASAEKLVNGLICRDVVSWTAVTSGCVLHGMFEKALVLFITMLEDGIRPNEVTMLSVIQACSLMSDSSLFGWVHALVMKLELDSNGLVVNSLVEMYAKNALVAEGIKIFFRFYFPNGDVCSDPDVVASLVHGCSHSESLERGREIHAYLIKMNYFPCTIIANSLMGMYAKHEQAASAHSIFRRMENRDIISWNTVISCFVKNGSIAEALQHLSGIHGTSGGALAPDHVTMLSSIQACSDIASLQQGQILHGYVIRSGFDHDVFICNALIDMYAKSGRIDLAEQIFKDMDIRDLGSWNSMIAAYGIHGDGNSALNVFAELKSRGRHKPNGLTFASIISACGHSGSTVEGFECFKSMHRDFGIEPSMEHYAAVVDLLGRSGKLDEAVEFIKTMPIKPGPSVWGSLLGACVLYENVEIAERAAEELSVLEPDGNVWRVALSNVYAVAGRWGDVVRLRAEMKREGLRKEAGWSYVEVGGMESFRFVVGDTRHPQTERIYEVWHSIKEHMLDACPKAV
ncbi:pentatricopeptide repeat-containing protein At4g21300-like [Phoenix dactylifera]|uniref:Pentatricopeptide repeat-containing protein At4g21300-like n=1 Tax=Phoenix dactylifera TaxID=42345 RepID=A0A8B8ZT87_PHODC|nr:pentatricopeptide repeat-containing protein At4g21300-like [Phoenix dactylifera]